MKHVEPRKDINLSFCIQVNTVKTKTRNLDMSIRARRQGYETHLSIKYTAVMFWKEDFV